MNNMTVSNTLVLDATQAEAVGVGKQTDDVDVAVVEADE
jgi:hypothetical protein|tara:strand:+ start:803 stop:919 length:117 start_codon:yes stop_codon:yes gene_type:complete